MDQDLPRSVLEPDQDRSGGEPTGAGRLESLQHRSPFVASSMSCSGKRTIIGLAAMTAVVVCLAKGNHPSMVVISSTRACPHPGILNSLTTRPGTRTYAGMQGSDPNRRALDLLTQSLFGLLRDRGNASTGEHLDSPDRVLELTRHVWNRERTPRRDPGPSYGGVGPSYGGVGPESYGGV